MPDYIYIPVPTPEMLEFARTWQEGQQQKGKARYEILRNYDSGWRKGAVRKLGFGVLRKVTPDDKVYILAHGARLGATDIGAKRGAVKIRENGVDKWDGGIKKGYTPKALADVLSSEGLTRQFRHLRVFACGSAIVAPGAEITFAQELAQELRKLGYTDIQVAGYRGNVKTSYVYRQVSGHPGQFTEGQHKGVDTGSHIFRAKDHREIY